MLNIDTEQKLNITTENLIGESVAVLGQKGGGKTNTVAVLLEELLPRMPACVVDIEGEYWGLKERFDILVAGKSPNVDVAIAVEQAGALAQFSIENNLSLVLDVSEFSEDERNTFLLNYFESLWQAAFTARKPYQIVLEEAHEFVPQAKRTELKAIFTRIALRGRKRGLGIILASQRSAKVEKDILTQCGIVILHRVRHPIDIKVYQEIVPLPPKEVERMINELEIGQAIVLYNHEIEKTQIRRRTTYHVGSTPTLDDESAPRLRQIDSTLLAELRKLEAAGDGADDLLSLRRTVRELEKANQTLALQVQMLTERNELLRKSPSVLAIAPNKAVSKEGVIIGPKTEIDGKTDQAVARESARYEQAIKREQARFDTLVRDVLKLKRMDRELVAYLLERDDKIFTLQQLSRELGFIYSTLYNNQPRQAIHLGLIKRVGRGNDTTYASTAWDHLEKTFPNLDTLWVFNQLVTQLKASFS